MSHSTNPQDTKSSANKSSASSSDPNDTAQDPQPESGFVDRQEEMTTRQSSPTNPRVNDKPEVNQEEA